MGNSGSSAIHLHPTRNSSNSGKENRPKRFSKYASPENRVLPPPIAGQKLRATDNGNILHNGGTISGRKVHVFQQRLEGEEEFLEILNRRSQLSDDTGKEVKPQFMYSHRKTQSDPDIARTLRELDDDEDDQDDDDDSIHHQRSIVAIGASKAKIKSRKKGRAPEPPGNLSRDLGHRSTSPSSERGGLHSTDYHRPKQDSSEGRSFQPAPLNPNIPIPPPPPPPDYFSVNRAPGESRPWSNNTRSSITYEKNKAPLQKWKQTKPSADVNSELLSRIRAKSMENINSVAESSSSDTKRNSVFDGRQNEPQSGNSNKTNRILSTMRQDARSSELFKEEILAAARRRASGLSVNPTKERPKSAHSNNSDKNSITNRSVEDPNQGRHMETDEKHDTNKCPKTYFFMGTVNKKNNNHNRSNEPTVPKDIRISSSPLSSCFAQKQLATNQENPPATVSGPTKAVISHTFGSSDKPVSTQKVIDLPSNQEERGQCNKSPQTITQQSDLSQSSKHSSKSSSANQDLVQRNVAEFCNFSENPYSLLCGAPGEQELKKSGENLTSQYTNIPPRNLNTGNSSCSSTASDDEDLEIDIQLRPTLPKRQFDLTRFSPTEAWRMLTVEQNGYNSPSEDSDEDGEIAYEDMIRMISKPVAPRRIIALDRCGDSGISPDAGSPALATSDNHFVNEMKSHMMQEKIQKSATNEREALDRGSRGGWTPLQDLDDSDVGSVDHDTPVSPTTKTNMFNIQAKFTLPNTMFASRSLQRTENDFLSKKNCNERQRWPPETYDNTPQQSHGFKHIKKALGLKLKTIPLGSPYIDSNWSMSRSIPHSLHKLGSKSEMMKERSKSVCHLHEDDELDGNNSRYLSSPALQNEQNAEEEDDERVDDADGRGDVYDADGDEENDFWSLPYRPSSNHVIYLPEYGGRSNTKKESSHNLNKVQQHPRNASNQSKQKRFAYQSTVRREQRKQIAEKLSREAVNREIQRQREIEWMNKVEEEFRKQREKEKRNIREQLLMLNRGGHNQGFDNAVADDGRSKNNENGKNIANERRKGQMNVENTRERDNFGREHGKPVSSAQDSRPRNQSGEDPWHQPSGMSKWLRRQRKGGDLIISASPRPEPEGGRSSGDEGKLLVESRKVNDETGRSSRMSGDSASQNKYKHPPKDIRERTHEISEFANRTPTFIEYTGTSPPPFHHDYNSLSYMGEPSSSSGFGSKGDSSPNTSPNDTFSSSENILLENSEKSKYFRASRPMHRSGSGKGYHPIQPHFVNGHNNNRDPRIVEAHLKANGEAYHQKKSGPHGFSDYQMARISQQKRYAEAIPNFRRKPRHSTDDSDSYSDELPYFSTPSPTCNGEYSRSQPFLRQNGTNEEDVCDRNASKRFSRNHPYRNGGRMKPQSPTTPAAPYLPLHKPGLPKPFNPKAEYRPVPFTLVSPPTQNHNSRADSAAVQQSTSYHAR